MSQESKGAIGAVGLAAIMSGLIYLVLCLLGVI